MFAHVLSEMILADIPPARTGGQLHPLLPHVRLFRG
jgi:hypothetical protein